MRVFPLSGAEAITFAGLAVHDFGEVLGQDTMSFARVTVQPSGRHPRARSRRSTKVYAVIAGSISFSGARVEVGDVIVIPAGEDFWYEADAAGAELLLLHLPAFRLEDEELLE